MKEKKKKNYFCDNASLASPQKHVLESLEFDSIKCGDTTVEIIPSSAISPLRCFLL